MRKLKRADRENDCQSVWARLCAFVNRMNDAKGSVKHNMMILIIYENLIYDSEIYIRNISENAVSAFEITAQLSIIPAYFNIPGCMRESGFV